jgi:hypothetical protein
MAIAQHYGIPTHGLDTTDKLEIALWFAQHEQFSFVKNGREYQWYRRKVADGKLLDDLPVVYILLTDLNLKRQLTNIVRKLGIRALRPMIQRAYLHYGGWGLHTNACAEDTVAAIFLHPEASWPPFYSVESMFPNRRLDQLYNVLLKLREECHDSSFRWGYEQLTEYRQPHYSVR